MSTAFVKPTPAKRPLPSPRPEKQRVGQRRKKPPREPAIEGRAFEQITRILLLAELIAPLRMGATLFDLAADVSELMGHRYHIRTIQRDMEFLHSLGVITYERTFDPSRPSGKPVLRARWAAGSIRSVVIERMASVASSRLDEDGNGCWA